MFGDERQHSSNVLGILELSTLIVREKGGATRAHQQLNFRGIGLTAAERKALFPYLKYEVLRAIHEETPNASNRFYASIVICELKQEDKKEIGR